LHQKSSPFYQPVSFYQENLLSFPTMARKACQKFPEESLGFGVKETRLYQVHLLNFAFLRVQFINLGPGGAFVVKVN
jgi:hypothetical protein